MAASIIGKHDTSYTDDKDVFYRGIEALLQGWTVLQLAVQHGFGGPYGYEKSQWFVGAIWQWFQENDDIEPEELEDFLGDILNTEFDTIAEDGSSSQICKKICKFFALYKSGDHSSILKEIHEVPKARLEGCAEAPGQDDGDDDQDKTNDVSQHNCEAMMSNFSLENGKDSAPANNESTKETDNKEEDDGWTVIKRGKKK
ncbi:pre-rRNA-processing protein TSR2 homolog [Anneissia japonica]|uniref:pre-rRNA-processing protein TSR2 homolog n=1 Tax=Anneissia japonica TaxID=1529436 RepID=UPI0014259375|nr:pre-rRNA-processing protein TSR2 homolog [Anneissia japonica]